MSFNKSLGFLLRDYLLYNNIRYKMFKNIHNNNVRSLDIKLRNDKFYDFMIYRGGCEVFNGENCIMADITPSSMSDGKVVSNTIWDGALNNGVVLKNIGFTGIDNGLIKFRRDKVSNEEFLNIFTKSTYEIESGDRRFFMFPVDGNSTMYEYPYSIESDESGEYLSLKGGFLQGFFKLEDEEYQTLPTFIDSDWTFEFVLRRKEYQVNDNTLNGKYPNNKGIFFYIGTRAENKFWENYNYKETMKDLMVSDNPDEESVIDNDYFVEISDEDNYFADDYQSPNNVNFDYIDPDDYYDDETDLSNIKVTTDNGYELDKRGYYEIVTDNKFVTFDHTKKGFTVDTFDENNPYVVFEGRNDWGNINYHPIMNHTKDGYTIDDINTYNEEHAKEFDVYNDLKNNAFALKINEDGSITYRYGVKDCDSETRYSVVEETTKPNLVPMDEWATIHLRCKILNPSSNKCEPTIGNRKMKLYIYVNGNLVLISKELTEFNFRALDDVNEKQETVPYNISLGGGTQGLADAIWLRYYKKSNYVLPLERDFGGSFLGDIKSFKFYNCFLDYKTLNTNVFKH